MTVRTVEVEENVLAVVDDDPGTSTLISELQFGYRKRLGTVDDVMSIIRDAWESKKVSLPHRKLAIMINFDIKNAFNSVPWGKVIAAQGKKEIHACIGG